MKQPFIKPTDAELEILQILWNKENASVREVHNIIATTKNVGYTTTLKLMQIMFEKGIVTRDASSKVHIYQAVIDKNETLNFLLDRITNALFGGSKAALINQVISENNISKEELNDIQQVIEQQKNNTVEAAESSHYSIGE